jgi:1,4-alpha-glucan branching enzyme
VDEEAEGLERKAVTASSPEVIEVDATPCTEAYEEAEDRMVTSGGKKYGSTEFASGKKGRKLGRQSSDKSTK